MLPPDEGYTSPVKNGWRFRHNKTGNIYTVVGHCKVKNRQTEKWENSIMYMVWPKRYIGGEIYVREESYFLDKFTQIHPSVHLSQRP